MEQSKALSKPDFRHILADINWEHGSHLVLAAKRSDSQGLLLKSVPFTPGSPVYWTVLNLLFTLSTKLLARLGV